MRTREGMSLIDVIKNSELTLSHMQKIERGAVHPRLSTLAKLAEAYGATLSPLLKNV